MFKHTNVGQISKNFSFGLNRRTAEYGKSFRANLSPVKVQYVYVYNPKAEIDFVRVLEKLIVAQQVKKLCLLWNKTFSYRVRQDSQLDLILSRYLQRTHVIPFS
jgi:hypothetical protein